MDEGKMKGVWMARAGTNTHARMTTRKTRERGRGVDTGTGKSIT